MGELTGAMAVVAQHVRLEFEVQPEVGAEIISPYWHHCPSVSKREWEVIIGDLGYGQTKHAIVRLKFPPQRAQESQLLRARLIWIADGSKCETDWQELPFAYAERAVCDREARDPEAVHWMGLHYSDRVQRKVIEAGNRGGALAPLIEEVQRLMAFLQANAGADRAWRSQLSDEIRRGLPAVASGRGLPFPGVGSGW